MALCRVSHCWERWEMIEAEGGRGDSGDGHSSRARMKIGQCSRLPAREMSRGCREGSGPPRHRLSPGPGPPCWEVGCPLSNVHEARACRRSPSRVTAHNTEGRGRRLETWVRSYPSHHFPSRLFLAQTKVRSCWKRQLSALPSPPLALSIPPSPPPPPTTAPASKPLTVDPWA